MGEVFRLIVWRTRLQLCRTRLDGCQAITCNSRAARIVRANHPDTITPLTARSRAAGSDQGGCHGMSAEAQMSLAPAQTGRFPRPVPDSTGIPGSVEAEVPGTLPGNPVAAAAALKALEILRRPGRTGGVTAAVRPSAS